MSIIKFFNYKRKFSTFIPDQKVSRSPQNAVLLLSCLPLLKELAMLKILFSHLDIFSVWRMCF